MSVFNQNLPAKAEGNIFKVFLQSEIGMAYKFFEGGLFGRIVNTNFSNMQFENYYTLHASSASFAEGGLLLRLGPPKVKLQIIGGLSKYLGNRGTFIENNPFIFGFGLNLKL